MVKTTRKIIITGPGRGKTTSALGMALRAAGHDMQILMIQFLKNDDSTGELAAASRLGSLEIHQMGLGFVPAREHPKWPEHRQAAEKALEASVNYISTGRYDMVILDEICGAVSNGLIPEEGVVELMRSVPDGMLLVLTGRGATDAMISQADTVSEVVNIHHGLSDGLTATPGVEY